jgi:DNA-binding transcriptional MerR regulator
MNEPTANGETAAPDLLEYSDWLTASQAAARLGISERTLRKRIKAGEVEAEKRPLDGGGLAWHVHLSAERTGSAPEAQRKSEPEARRKSLERETETNRKRTGSATENAPEVSEPRTGSVPEADARGELLEHLRTENEYLKEQVNAWRLQTEAANRTASETAAALRKVLDALPKQLEAPRGSTPARTPTSAENVTEAARSGEVEQPAQSTPNATQGKPQRPARPLWKVILGVR